MGNPGPKPPIEPGSVTHFNLVDMFLPKEEKRRSSDIPAQAHPRKHLGDHWWFNVLAVMIITAAIYLIFKVS